MPPLWAVHIADVLGMPWVVVGWVVAGLLAAVAARVGPAGVLQRLDAVLACREALERNVKPRIAVEAMTAALRLP